MSKIVLTFFTHCLLVTILIGLNANTAAQVTSKIVGGVKSNSTEWPWMAGLVIKDLPDFEGQFCGASLIAKQWVLTAAHCVVNEDITSFDVIINRAQLNSRSGERIPVERILIHGLYNKITFDNDIALIKLSTPSSNPPITFLSSHSSQDNAGKSAIALGWGTISALKDIYPVDLQQVTLAIADSAQCSINLPGITQNMLCAGVDAADKDTCTGDSGGPLIVFDTASKLWRLAGITSWGIGCAQKGFYGVYTRIKNYASLISEIICTASQKPMPSSLTLNIEGNLATANWTSTNSRYNYRLNYAPFPQAQPISSIDLNDSTQFSALLDSGSAFYVAITSYKDNCASDFSNIEHFVIQ